MYMDQYIYLYMYMYVPQIVICDLVVEIKLT